MEQDCILEVGIDKKGRLYLKPSLIKFPQIYREAMEVHWSESSACLYGAKPRNWEYINWYSQIIKAAKEQSCCLILTDKTLWVNIPSQLKLEISEF